MPLRLPKGSLQPTPGLSFAGWQDLKDKFRECGNVVYANVTRGDDGGWRGLQTGGPALFRTSVVPSPQQARWWAADGVDCRVHSPLFVSRLLLSR